MKRLHLAATAAVALMVGFSPGIVWATLLFSITVDGVPVANFVDNCVASVTCPGGDQNPAIGTLALAANLGLGGTVVNGSMQTSNSPGAPGILNSSSLQISAAAAHDIVATVGDTGFAGPANIATASASGTVQNGLGSSYTYNFFNDPANGQGAENVLDTPGTQFATFSFTATNPLADAYSFASGPVAVMDPATYSMTQTVSAHLIAGEVWVGQSATSQKTNQVPEVRSLTMLGTGLTLFGIGFIANRRRQAHGLR